MPPTPGYYYTPDGASSGAPCSKEEYEAQVARDKVYDEAERVYHRLTTAEKGAFLNGDSADEEILRHTIDEPCELVIQSHADGARLVEGDVEIEWIRRSPEMKGADDAVVITSAGTAPMPSWKPLDMLHEATGDPLIAGRTELAV